MYCISLCWYLLHRVFAEQSFSALRRFTENLTPQQRFSNMSRINMEREYANSVLSNDMDHDIDIFSGRNALDTYSFKRVLLVM